MAGEIEVCQGDIVWYHGSIKDAHGMYRVANVYFNPQDATVRSEIRPLDKENTRFLYNTRSQSVTIIRRVNATDA